ncbi:MAG: cell division protein FtsZ [Deltaproteobacteria bacterium]|nr:cell division protein FtsZ [Deltaproteobacteria bacterium]
MNFASSARIKVVGVGGGGGNAVQHMIDSGLRGVDFICANTDIQALHRGTADCKLQLGERLTKGLGAGANPVTGREAAVESVAAIKECLADAEMVFVTAGMGGGTGTGAAPVIAQIAKEQGSLTVGVVTKPFVFEGARKKANAEEGIAELCKYVDCLITIPNDRLMTFAPKKATALELFRKANDILYFAVKGISDVIKIEGYINVDFADVRTAMSGAGLALMSTGVAMGENRARDAAMRAISSPLLEDVSIDGAKAVLYNITASMDITGDEILEIGTIIKESVHEDANVIFGMVYDENAGDELRITVIATGIAAPPKPGASSSAHTHVSGNVTPFPSGGKQSSAQQSSMQMQAATALTTGGGQRRGRITSQRVEENIDLLTYGAPWDAFGGRKASRPAPGETDFIFDEEEFEMPAFIRKLAD